MSPKVTVRGANRVAPLNYAAYPGAGSLKDLFHLGGDARATTANLAKGRGNATIAGNDLEYENGYIRFRGAVATNRLTMATNESEFASFTRIAVVRHVDAIANANDWRQAIGYYNGATAGVALFSTAITMGNGDLRQASIGVQAPPHTNFQFIAQTYDNKLKKMAAFYGFKGNVYAGGSYTGATAAARCLAPMLIGGQALLGSNDPTLDIAMAAQHGAVLTPPQMKAIYAYEKSRLSRNHGIDVA